MSTTANPLHHLAETDPLASPLVTSVALFDYAHPPPGHLRRLYGDVRRALSEAYPHAPTKLCEILPREHGKSEGGTVVVPTWAALDNPNIRVLIMSETETQASDFLDEITEHVERLAPQFNRAIKKSNSTELTLERDRTHKEPTIRAAGFETGVTGGHYDLLIFDDLVSYDTQRTPARRETAWEKFQDYLNLGSEGKSVYIVLGTRKHREDLYHHLIAAPAWQSRVEQAITDWSVVEDGAYTVTVRDDQTGETRSVGGDDIASINGERETVVDVTPKRQSAVLWPERWPLSALIGDLIGGFGAEESTLVWRRENQNDPTVFEGQLLSADMLTFVGADTIPESTTTYAGIDLGVEADPEKAARNDTDYWAIAIGEYHRASDTTYVTGLYRKRGLSLQRGVEWVERTLRADYDGDTPARILAESNQAQRWFTQTARDTGLRVEESSSSGSKEERILDMSARVESGRVVFVDGAQADGWESFTSEWCAFPTGSHDDRLDAIEIMLRGVRTTSDVRTFDTADLF